MTTPMPRPGGRNLAPAAQAPAPEAPADDLAAPAHPDQTSPEEDNS